MKRFQKIRRQEILILIALMLAAFSIRILIGTLYPNYFDIGGYNIPWALASQEGLFQIYSNAANLDYPPVFPALLSLVAKGVQYAIEIDSWQLQMFLMKLIPILFDTAIVGSIYLIALKYRPSQAVAFGLIWLFNPSSIFNCSFWGQTDCMMLLFLLLMFYFLQRQQSIAACICFAIGCLTKLQMAYFAPILLLELIFYYPIKRVISSLAVGLGVGIAGWLPFMIGSQNWKLPFEIYFGGFNSYPYIVLNAYNLYGALGWNQKSDQSTMVASINFQTGSAIITLVLLVLLIAVYFCAKRNHLHFSPVFLAAFFFNAIFMLTIRQHERYQVPIVSLLLLCLLFSKRKAYLFLFIGSVIITTINQATLLFAMNFRENYQQFQQNSLPFFSAVNLVLFLCSIAITATVLLSAFKQTTSAISLSAQTEWVQNTR